VVAAVAVAAVAAAVTKLQHFTPRSRRNAAPWLCTILETANENQNSRVGN